MKIFVECRKAKEKGTLYHVLALDLGYRVAVLTMDKDTICESANLRYSELYSMKEGQRIDVGTITVK